MRILLTCLFCWAVYPLSAHANTGNSLPVLPEQQVETELSKTPVTGHHILIQVSSDAYQNCQALQHAIDGAVPGDEILVPHALYLCGSLELKTKEGTGWITIRASDQHLPREGQRVSPRDESRMPIIISPGFNVPPLRSESGAHHYRLVGLDITKLNPNSFVQELVIIDAEENTGPGKVTELAQFPHNIIFDRCYIHGLPSNDLKRGIRLYCLQCAVIDSYISEVHVVGQEAQPILFLGGPIKIWNNYLEGAGENLFAQDYMSLRTARFLAPPTMSAATLSCTDDLEPGDGIAIWDGAKSIFTHVVATAGNQVQYESLSTLPSRTATVFWGRLPTDIDIGYNYLYKPLALNPNDASYAGYHPTVKNLFELKSGRRIYVHDNLFENNWIDGQDGTAILLTVRNQTGDCYFCAVEDITFENNIVINACNGIGVLATDYLAISGPTQDVLVRGNLFLDIGNVFQVNTIDREMIDRNTMLVNGYIMSVEKGAIRKGNQITNNIVMSDVASGLHYNDGVAPDWRSVFPGWVFASNIFTRIDGFSAFFYMKDFALQNFEVDSPEDVGFVSWQAGNLQVSSDSWAKNVATDSGVVGADVATLSAKKIELLSGISVGSTPRRAIPVSQPIRALPAPSLIEAVVAPAKLTTLPRYRISSVARQNGLR